MAGTDARIGFGCLLKMGNDASPQVFNSIAQVFSLGEFGAERALIDKTNFDSPSFMEYILNLPDGTELTVSANFLPNDATQNTTTGMIKAVTAAVERDFQFVIRDSYSLAAVGTFSFAGLPRSWKANPQVTSKMDIVFLVKITGAITYAAA